MVEIQRVAHMRKDGFAAAEIGRVWLHVAFSSRLRARMGVPPRAVKRDPGQARRSFLTFKSIWI
jgi:hypothetical protein